MEKALFVATYGDFFASFLTDKISLLQKRGVEVACAANFEEAAYNRATDRLRALGVKIWHIPFTRTPYSWKNFKAYRLLVRLMKEKKITLVDCHNPVAGGLARLAAARAKIRKVIYTAHGFFFYKGAPLKYRLLYRPVEYWLAKKTDILIVMNGEDLIAAQKMRVRKEVRFVHGMGVDLSSIKNTEVKKAEKRRELGVGEEEFLFASVGECIARKNHLTALRAFQKSGLKNARYLIVGAGELLSALQREASELGVGERTVFAGYRTDVKEILKVSDAFVFPSLQEGLSVALVESMAAGLPAICSDIRGNRDCIVEGRGGFLVPPKDEDGFAQAMKRLYFSAEERRSFGAYNRAEAEKFEKTAVIKEYEEIYQSIL